MRKFRTLRFCPLQCVRMPSSRSGWVNHRLRWIPSLHPSPQHPSPLRDVWTYQWSWTWHDVPPSHCHHLSILRQEEIPGHWNRRVRIRNWNHCVCDAERRHLGLCLWQLAPIPRLHRRCRHFRIRRCSPSQTTSSQSGADRESR